MRLAALQSDIVWEDPDANFERLRPWIATAATAGARLLLLPEMFACGFSMATDRIAETSDGPSAQFLRQQAKEHGLWIAGSLPELEAGAERPHNTLLLVGPDGTEHRYRKIHPFTYAREHESYRAGDSFTTVDIEGVRCTLFICYDLRFADEFWATARDTDVYLVAANWPEARRHHWQALAMARAIENQAYVVAVNRVGSGGPSPAKTLHYTGDSRILDPMGNVLAAASGGETLLIADVDPARVAETREKFPFLADRR